MSFKFKKKFIILPITLILFFQIVFSQENSYFSSNIKRNIINNKSKYVYPCGNLVAIKASTDGVLVVGYEKEDVEYIGGIKKGDNIIKINNQNINDSKDIYNILSKVNEDYINITIERDNKYMIENVKLKEVESKKRLGLWVRDRISGIGTMTFYDPNKDIFGAIGHPIKDTDTNELLKVRDGKIYQPQNINVEKSKDENVGKFEYDVDENILVGNFNNNSSIGISGNLSENIKNNLPLIEIGSKKDVELGEAYILLEDENRVISSYKINIVEIIKNEKNKQNLVIEVVDDNLIEYTGGIIQGMSGSPIIQNDKLIGALTHVFKSDTKKGYGIFIDEMIELDKRN